MNHGYLLEDYAYLTNNFFPLGCDKDIFAAIDLPWVNLSPSTKRKDSKGALLSWFAFKSGWYLKCAQCMNTDISAAVIFVRSTFIAEQGKQFLEKNSKYAF